jgi:hypothetical protein
MDGARRCRSLASRPVACVTVVALVLRTVLVLDAWRTNPLVRTPQLDGPYFLEWAADIARGDWAGASGVVGGAPFVLNPLYAYVLAPFAAVAPGAVLPILLFQAALGAGTAALAAATAARCLGTGAAWVRRARGRRPVRREPGAGSREPGAGSREPGAEDDARGHGPVAAGVWLGLGALARPVTPLALPFVACGGARAACASR